MHKFLSVFFTILAVPLLSFGKAKDKKDDEAIMPPPPPAYDADLYHKDVNVYVANAEFLYWTVNEGALDYAQTMNQPAWSTTESYAVGKVQSASFNLDPGVRLSAGYFNALKYWLVQVEYTHLIARGKDRASKPTGNGEYLTGTWPHITPLPLQHAHSRIFLRLQPL